MELENRFSDFLKETVNLNATRISNLESSVEAIKNFVTQSTWKPEIIGFEEQGSWAHDTIIKPVDKGEFDADLLVKIKAVDGWTAKHYIIELGKVFRESATYKKKVKVWDYCVTITYANEKKIDIAPLIAGRTADDLYEVCNKKTDSFERSEPEKYTSWLVEQNKYSGGNSFRKVTRLLKYLRDIKTRFVCPSVLLTTLLANHIFSTDKGADGFKNVPTTLKTVVGRLDDWLQEHERKPSVCNPFLPSEDFAASWTDAQYESFRTSINRYRGWIDDAYNAPTIDESIDGWRKLFGKDFAAGVVTKSATDGRYALADPTRKFKDTVIDLIDMLRIFGSSAIPKNYSHLPHMSPPAWQEGDDELEVVVSAYVGGGPKSANSRPVASGELLSVGKSIYFEALQPNGSYIGPDYRIQWRVTNSLGSPTLRGGFEVPNEGALRRETLQYRGVHITEAFVIRKSDSALVAVSDPFFVAIE